MSVMGRSAASGTGSFIGVCGDVHGHLQLALVAWALEAQQTGRALDAILLCGDVGTFTSDCPPDKATVRHAVDNPCELEFLAWSTQPPAPWLEGIFAPVGEGGLGLQAPVIMVTGNHEGFAWIELLLGDLAEPPGAPVSPDVLPQVDARGRVRLLPPGWRVRTAGGRIVAGIGGIQPGQRLGARYPHSAYIAADAVGGLRPHADIDILITHQGPARVQGPSAGAEILDPLLDAPTPTLWFHGHSRRRREPMTLQATTVHPLGDATFDKSAGWRVARDAWATVSGPHGAVTATVAPPQRLDELQRAAWTRTAAHQLVAPHLAAWINRSSAGVDIKSGASYPAGALSNFARHPFRLRGLRVNSMEGLLQGLKCRSPKMQTRVFTLDGAKAKKAGAKHDWKADQTLYWQGTPIDRHSDTYQALLNEAYRTMFDHNHNARRALLATGDAVLTHSIGEPNPHKSVLTTSELCDRLMRIRDELRDRA
jgi:predicted NAD-dependent protein-ADP-ribosyltransferase YbiA (DUF1768 family)